MSVHHFELISSNESKAFQVFLAESSYYQFETVRMKNLILGYFVVAADDYINETDVVLVVDI